MDNKFLDVSQVENRYSQASKERLGSRRVAKMMEVDHSKLLRKIDGFNTVFTKAKIGFSKYWIESSYKDGSGKTNKEYEISKLGCEFLANKTTGEKGILFTDRYMTAFEEMKDYIKKKNTRAIPEEIYKALSPELQAIFSIDKKYSEIKEYVDEIKDNVHDLKNNMPLFNVDCDELQKEVKRVGIKALGGKGSLAYKDKSIRTKVYSDIQQQVKRQFDVKSYKAIKRCQLEIAKEIINNYKLPFVLEHEIEVINNQVCIQEAACTKEGY